MIDAIRQVVDADKDNAEKVGIVEGADTLQDPRPMSVGTDSRLVLSQSAVAG